MCVGVELETILLGGSTRVDALKLEDFNAHPFTIVYLKAFNTQHMPYVLMPLEYIGRIQPLEGIGRVLITFQYL